MNIGLIHPSFHVIGGAEYTSFSIIDALKNTTHFTTLYTLTPPKVSETNNFKIAKISKSQLPLPYNYKKWQDYKKIYDSSENEDLLFISGGGLMLDFTKVSKVFLYCHSIFDAEYEFIRKNFKGIKGFFFKKAQNRIQKSFSYLNDPKIILISNSNYTKEIMKTRYGRESTVIYPPVEIDKFLKLYDAPKINRIITLCRISREKNLDFAIDVANETGLVHEIGGRVNPRQKNYYESLQKKVSNITWHIDLPQEEKANILATSKVFFHSAEETFGISVVEGIASGCIPIVPNNSSNKETVPYEELRYEGKEDAIEKIQNASNGKYDYLKPMLKNHIQKFSKSEFQKNIIAVLES